MNATNEDRLFQLYVICLEARMRPNAVNGDKTAEEWAYRDAIRAYNYFLEMTDPQMADDAA